MVGQRGRCLLNVERTIGWTCHCIHFFYERDRIASYASDGIATAEMFVRLSVCLSYFGIYQNDFFTDAKTLAFFSRQFTIMPSVLSLIRQNYKRLTCARSTWCDVVGWLYLGRNCSAHDRRTNDSVRCRSAGVVKPHQAEAVCSIMAMTTASYTRRAELYKSHNPLARSTRIDPHRRSWEREKERFVYWNNAKRFCGRSRPTCGSCRNGGRQT